MGINMDIRQELEYNFLNTDDLNDTDKNRLLNIVRPLPGQENLKLPWDIGEKEYDIETEVVDNQVDDGSSQWQHYGEQEKPYFQSGWQYYPAKRIDFNDETETVNFVEGMPDGIVGYEGCMAASSMIATTIPPVFGPHPIVYTDGMTIDMTIQSGMTIPFGNSGASGDPNSYSYNGPFTYNQSGQPIYTSGAEMMVQAPPPPPPHSRENERRGGRGRGGGGGKRDSYNRIMNSNNDMQSNYAVPGQHQYSTMVQMAHPPGAMHVFPTQQHPATGTPFYLQPGATAYPQGMQMHHNNHTAYGHHSSNYTTHPHSPNPSKYRGQGQATYYDQENVKNPPQKHHVKRGHHQDNCTLPPFRHSSNHDIESPKRTYQKIPHVKSDVRNNVVHNNSNARYTNNKKPPFPVNEVEVVSAEIAPAEEKITVVVAEVTEVQPAVDDKTVAISPIVEDKIQQEKETLPPAAEVITVKIKVEPQNPPKPQKVVENVVPEPKEAAIAVAKIEKTHEEPQATKIPETPLLPATVVVPVTVVPVTQPAPPPSSSVARSWANIAGGDNARTTPQPLPITKLPVSRAAPPVYPPVTQTEIVPPPKYSFRESTVQQQSRNGVASPSIARNNAKQTPKSTENLRLTETKTSTENSTQNDLNDPAVFRTGELLLKYQMDKQTVSLLPRGLTNRSNYCYINSILQALLACPPFYNLLMALPHPRYNGKNSSTPLIDNMTKFVREFSPLAEGARMPRKDRSQKRGEDTPVDVQCGVAFEPSYVYTMLKNTSSAGVFSVEGRQEDAEEFLSCLLNGISDEMLELMKLVNGDPKEPAPDTVDPNHNANHNNEEEGWKVMGPKNKGSITRCTEFGRTPLSDIFRGQLRSRVIRVQEESTDNVQPFFTLQLEIEKVESVEGALETLFAKDRVEGMTCSKTKQQIEAWKQTSLEELPIILILHLKWFDYKLDGCSKIVKRVEFPIDLKLDSKKLLSSNVAKKLIGKQNQYKLFAVTYHDGKEASKGHYVTDAFHVGYGAWVRYDDSSVKGINEKDVLNPLPPRVPYLLYYRRCDTIGNNPPNTPRTR